MTATTLTLLSPSTPLFKFTSPFFDRNMDGSEMDYLHTMGMSENLANSSLLHQQIQQRRPPLVVEMPPADSLQTPDFRPDDKNPFNIYHPITPSSDFPTPTIQHMLNQDQRSSHPLIVQPLDTIDQPIDSQMDAIPEPVAEAQNEYRQQHESQPTSLVELHPSEHSMCPGYQYEQNLNTSMVGSPQDSQSSNSSSPSYSHDDRDSGDQFISTSPGHHRSGSVTGMSSGNYGSTGSRKSGRPTKKQQYDQMVERKKNMEMENQKLKRKADDYTIACKKLREKLLTLIQNNRGVGQVM